MELWRELAISALQNETYDFDFLNDKFLKEIIESECYKVLKEIKDFLDEEILSDEDCFIKIEEIIGVLEKNNIFCNRHDFG